jgi:two-component system response regulator FlrC
VGRSVLEADRRGREQQIIVETLRSLGGSRRAAAERLGISERTLRYKLAKLREAGVELPR